MKEKAKRRTKEPQTDSTAPPLIHERSDRFCVAYSDEVTISHSADHLTLSFFRFEINRPYFEQNRKVEEAKIHLPVREALMLTDALIDSLKQWRTEFGEIGRNIPDIIDRLQPLASEPEPQTNSKPARGPKT